MVITNLPATISMYEDVSVSTFIFEAQALYASTWSTVVSPDFTYSLLTEASNFQIDSSSGMFLAMKSKLIWLASVSLTLFTMPL